MIRTELKRGTAELAILSVLEEGPLHGYQIGRQIGERSGGALQYTLAALYPMLYRMEHRGWLRAQWETGDNGKRRRCYRLTARGRKVLAPLRAEWADLFRVLRRVAAVTHAWLDCVRKSASGWAQLRCQGLCEQDARRLTEEEVTNWRELCEQIVRAKQEDRMENRVRQLWIPGLVTFFGAAVSLVILGELGVEPAAFSATPMPPVMFYIPWLMVLPVFGALGAFLARRANSQGVAVHISSTFPAILMAIAMVTTLIIVLLVHGRTQTVLTPGTFLTAGLSWVLVPGVTLLVGDKLFQWFYNKHEQNSWGGSGSVSAGSVLNLNLC
jgi:PadR family transcriptional regulator PadR